MAITSIIAEHAEHVSYQSSTSLAHAAAQTNGDTVGGASLTLQPVYFHISLFNVYVNKRAFVSFDLSDYTGTITGLTIKLTRYVRSV